MRGSRGALLAAAALIVGLAGCGGSSSSNPSPPPAQSIAVALGSQPPSSLAAGATTSLGANVSNDSSNGGVRWTATCGASACGTFSAASTASGANTTYTAPSAATTVTITATSVADSTKSASSAPITITAPPVQPISVALATQPPMSLVAGTTTGITANVTNDSANAGVNWTVTCGSSPCGSFSPAQTASGTATTYTAPTTVPNGNAVTVTATSVTDNTKSATATITITAPVIPITVALAAQPPTSLAVNVTTSIMANVANDSANGGVKWTVTCGGSTCGSFNPAQTASGAATIFVAPTAVPTGNTVTVTATSVTDSTKSATATITITALSGSPLANGTYVYHLSGQDSFGPCFFVGAFTVSGGSITGGNQDFSDSNMGYTNQITSSGSTLGYAADGTVQVALTTANTNLGNKGTITLRGTKTSATRVVVSEYDGFAVGSGSIDLQTSTAAPSGGLAFLIAGVGFDTSNNLQATGIGGVLNITGTTVSTTGSVFDINFGGDNRAAQAFASGTVSAPDSLGRFSIGLTPNSSLGLADFVLTGYVVGPNQIQLVESQQDDLGFNLGGMALTQGSNTGNFSQASLASKTYVYGVSGVDTNGVLDLAGTFAFGSNNNISGAMALNDLSNVGVNTISGGTYTVDPTGRVSLDNVAFTPINGTFFLQMYLDGNGNALVLGADEVELTAGPAYLQTTSTPTVFGAYGLSTMGFLTDQNGTPWSAAGPVTINSGSYTGFTDYSYGFLTGATLGTTVATQSLSGTTNSSSGVISLTGLNAVSFTGANSFVSYPVDGNRVVSISIDSGLLSLGTLESVKP